MRLLLWSVLGAGILIAGAAVAGTDRDLAVTIYGDDLALIQDQREIDLAAGRQRIEFADVSAQIRPETASLSARDIRIVEQNFDFDLLTPAKLMEKAVGHVVTIVRVNPATGAETREQAEVLAANGGVILKIGERIEVLRDDGLPVRVIFDKVPDNLRARPTLSVTLETSHAGKRGATLSYLTPGLGWHADYVALYDAAAGKIDVQGWITLTNTSGTTYTEARTLLVAGTPSQVDSPAQTYNQWRPPVRRGNLEAAGTETGTRERLGDFYLYPLPERTTIANQQTKQVSFLDVHGVVPAEHAYEFRNAWLASVTPAQSAKSVYRFSTSAHAGLGDQLRAGVLRFYLHDQRGEPQFIGEDRIEHTPMGSTLSLVTGDAFDVKVKAVVAKRTRKAERDWQTDMRYEFTNASPAPVIVTLLQTGLWGDARIVAQSQPSLPRSADVAEWAVSVPANGQSQVTASFETQY